MASILYSFRRCPYALRARLALAAAGLEPGPALELREVALQTKPPELLQASPKGTVPVLVLPDGTVLDQSLAILHWALERADPQGWWQGWDPADRQRMAALITENDGPFKHHLDRFKYPDRYPGETSGAHRLAALAILRRWQQLLLLRIPAALPYFFTGLRIAATISPIGAVVAEMNAGSSAGDGGGLGFQAVIFASQAKYAALFATAATTCLLGFALNAAVLALSWSALHAWHDSYERTDR
jgi:glutathione S-transferase